jgi:lysozyme
MQLSAKGLALLKKSEGFGSHSYLDVAGVRTIGYGHRILPAGSFPNGIDEARGAELLTADVRVAENAVKRLVKVELAQSHFDALVDFVYNLGPRKLEASTLLRMLNMGRYGAAADEMLRWDHAGAHENAGLKARREAEFLLWHSEDSGQRSAA